MIKKTFQDEVDVLKFQREKLHKLNKNYSDLNDEIDNLEEKLQEFMKSKNIENLEINEELLKSKNNEISNEKKNELPNKSFNDLVHEANLEG